MPDPAAGKFEMPGGHVEGTETPRAAATREWQEETGLNFPDGEWTGTWTSPDGIYQGFVYTIAREADLDIFDRQLGSDPDGDVTGSETIAWWDPADLPGNPAIRPELLADIDAVVAALGCTPDCCGGECCQGGCCGGTSGCQCGTGEVAKAGGSAATPKGRKRKHWPGWDLDLTTAEHWAPKVTAAILAALPASRLDDIARDYLTAYPPADAEGMGKWDLNGQATDWLRQHAPDLSAAILALVAGILADSYLIGAASAAAMTGGGKVNMGGWQPGDTAAAQDGTAGLGLGDDYDDTTDSQTQGTADQIAGGFLAALGRALATGQQQGATPGTLGGVLRQAISDHGLAAGLVGTVITAISSLAAKAWYRLTAVQQGFWQTADDGRVCPTCQQNEDAGPLPMGDAYPSGDTEPPAHGRCRCALIPA